MNSIADYVTHDLNRLHYDEVAADLREFRVKNRIDDMLVHDPEYNPWTFANFSEAMSNMPDAAMLTICGGCGAAIVDSGNE